MSTTSEENTSANDSHPQGHAERELEQQIVELRVAVQSGSNGREHCFTDDGIAKVVQLIQARVTEALAYELENIPGRRVNGRDYVVSQAYLIDRIADLKAQLTRGEE